MAPVDPPIRIAEKVNDIINLLGNGDRRVDGSHPRTCWLSLGGHVLRVEVGGVIRQHVSATAGTCLVVLIQQRVPFPLRLLHVSGVQKLF